MTTIAPIALRQAAVNTEDRPGIPNVYGLHHWGFRCKDAEETRHFYEDVLGLPLSAVVYHEHVPSTKEYCPYLHIFFEMADGSHLAFFDLFDGKGYTPDPETPSWLHHMALEVDSHESLELAKARLEKAGVEVLGIVKHSMFDSIYFYDPNGMRLELALRTASLGDLKKKAQAARDLLASRSAKIAEFKRLAAERAAKGVAPV